MKSIILLLSVVFVSCVTANTGKRDLSGINEKPAQGQTPDDDQAPLVKNQKLWQDIRKKQPKENQTDQFDQKDDSSPSNCREYCSDATFYDYEVCYCKCQIENMFSQTERKVAMSGENSVITELMLATDYDTCVRLCICEGGRSSVCHRVCEE